VRRTQESLLRNERRHEAKLDIAGRKRQAGERDRLAAAVEQSADGIVITDTDWRITYANVAFASSVGRVPSGLVGMRAPDVAAIGLDETTLADMVRTVSAGHRWFREVDHRNPEGALRRIEANIAPIREADGEVSSWVGVIRDVTELRGLEQRMRTLFDFAGDAIMLSEPGGKFIEVNRAACERLGYSREELLTLSPADIDAPESAALVPARTEALISGGAAFFETTQMRRDGTLVPAELSATVVDWGGSKAFLSIARDTTERIRAAEALRASEARLRTAMDTMVDGVSVLSALRDEGGRIVDFRIDYSNAAIGHISRVPAGEQIGHTLLGLFPAHRTNGLFDAYVGVVETGAPFESADLRYVDPAASGGPLDQVLDQRAAKMGDGYVLSVRDVTEREQARGERDRLAAVVEESADGIVITAPDGRILYANSASAFDIGQGLGDLTGQVLPLIMTERLGARVVAKIDRTIKAGRPWLSEVAMTLPDRTLRQIQVSVTPRLDADGAISSHVTVFRDVTDLREAETERTRLTAAVENAADLVIVSDLNGIIEYVNPAFEHMTGNSAADVVDRSKASVLRSYAHSPEFYAGLDGAVRRGEPWEGMITVRRRDGSLFEYEASFSPIRDADGALIGTVEIGRDRTHEHEMEADLALAAGVRGALDTALHAVPEVASFERAGQALCDALGGLPGIDFVTVFAFGAENEIAAVAHHAPPGFPQAHGRPSGRAAEMHERAALGPWAEAWEPNAEDGIWGRALTDLGTRAAAFGPIVHGRHADGVVMVTTSDERLAHILLEKRPMVLDLSTTPSALLAERLHTMRGAAEMHAALTAVLAAGSFHPVFQPIVELASREIVGYEALTRFDSGQQPDLCFADAWSVGLGSDLEMATIEAAIAEAKKLPSGRWLDLNISPRLLADPERVRAALWSADRPIVLEITEHELIEDYGAVREAVRALGKDVRLAVDDAGAGVANFGHIIELRPDLVKLDISLVRRVNANLGRQAMVVGMRHFSRTAGCRLVAEGVETEEEARTLTELGVEFGQGLRFGHPERADRWIAAAPSRTASGRGAARSAESRRATHGPRASRVGVEGATAERRVTR
jgi:PAS domain S-box-containing protein